MCVCFSSDRGGDGGFRASLWAAVCSGSLQQSSLWHRRRRRPTTPAAAPQGNISSYSTQIPSSVNRRTSKQPESFLTFFFKHTTVCKPNSARTSLFLNPNSFNISKCWWCLGTRTPSTLTASFSHFLRRKSKVKSKVKTFWLACGHIFDWNNNKNNDEAKSGVLLVVRHIKVCQACKYLCLFYNLLTHS